MTSLHKTAPLTFFCDTSFFFAALYPPDIHHRDAAEISRLAALSNGALCTTWDIISETTTLLRIKAGYRFAIIFLDEIRPALEIVSYEGSVRNAAEKAFKRLGQDKPLSYCDAVSFSVVTLLLNNIAALSFDRDFRRLGLTVIDSSTAFSAYLGT